jgi:DNA-directed RNA polymerase specialized sigma24 family protein
LDETKKTWDEWLSEQGPALTLVALQWCASTADAEDAVQEGFMRFWRSRKTARDPHGYLFACVRNAAHDFGR